ncbi:hypothetical protein E2562_030159, partial [Oryza meyeriana var. granulata]
MASRENIDSFKQSNPIGLVVHGLQEPARAPVAHPRGNVAAPLIGGLLAGHVVVITVAPTGSDPAFGEPT